MAPVRRQLRGLPLLVSAMAAVEAQAAHGSAASCGTNNGGCVPGTRCSVQGGRIDCDYSHTCPTLVAPANGFVDCPGAAPGAQPTYSLRLAEGNVARSVERRTQCSIGCNSGFSASGFTLPRFCTATGWSDTSAVRCTASPQCSPSNNPCQHGGRCTATVNGGYRCSCAAGWAGTNCHEADSVSQHAAATACLDRSAPSDCPPAHAPRVKPQGSRVLSVANRTRASPPQCIDPSTHRVKPGLCQNGGHCRNIVGGSYGCVCRTGFAGLHCAYENPCSTVGGRTNPCQHGGRCLPQTKPPPGQQTLPHRCKCHQGYGGPNCATQLSSTQLAACSKKPCLNHGNCLVLFNTTMCTCPPGFGGKRCELHDTHNDCNPNPCRNGGVCHDLHNKFECVCPPNFRGATCQEKDEINDCADCLAAGQGEARCSPTPCLNGGQCQDLFHAFSCKCTPSFGGDRCELASTNSNACASSPCQNGAQVCVQCIHRPSTSGCSTNLAVAITVAATRKETSKTLTDQNTC